MIHIVFNLADVLVLQKAIELDESLAGEVVLIEDDYSVGPIDDLYQKTGADQRREWWAQILAGSELACKAESNEGEDLKSCAGLVGTMRRNEVETIWIWAAQNKHDVSGYYFLLHYLREFPGRVFILYLNNLPFINEKGGIFYPQWLHEIQPSEFLKAKKLAREITASEWEIDGDEWLKLANENKGVRILEGGKKLAQSDYSFYDAALSKYITPDWQKVSKIFHQFFSKEKETTGDAFLFWRLKTILSLGEYDVQGDQNTFKGTEIKLKSE